MYLDVPLNLIDGTYKPYRKPNDETLYVHAKSNHPRTLQNRSQFPLKTVYAIYLQANKFLMNQLHISKKHCKVRLKLPIIFRRAKQIKITAPTKEGHEKKYYMV